MTHSPQASEPLVIATPMDDEQFAALFHIHGDRTEVATSIAKVLAGSNLAGPNLAGSSPAPGRSPAVCASGDQSDPLGWDGVVVGGGGGWDLT